MKTKSKTKNPSAKKQAQRTLGREEREDRRCLDQVDRWLRVADKLPAAKRRASLRVATEQVLLASMVSLVASADAEKLRAKLRKDPQLLATVLNAFIRLSANLQKQEAPAKKGEALTAEGNDEITKNMNLM
jgi:hypothetical protein